MSREFHFIMKIKLLSDILRAMDLLSKKLVHILLSSSLPA